MDKELLRIVIIGTGLIVITGMLLWAFIKNSRRRRSLEDLAEDEASRLRRRFGEFTDEEASKTVSKKSPALDDDFEPSFEDDFDRVDFGDEDLRPAAADKSGRLSRPFVEEAPDEDEDYEPEPRFSAPSIIQFSLVANQDEGFNGLDLARAFNIVGLEYGNLKIYERLDSNRLVDFGVASMVPPGTFPERNLEEFVCPGIVFFMQPGELEDPVPVFEDFVQTISFMATELDGTVLDHHRQPLTEKTIDLILRSL